MSIDNPQSLDDVLKGVEPEIEAEPEEPVEEQIEEVEATAEPEKQEQATPAVAQESESWTKSAVLDERRKRQEAENRIKEMEARFAAQQQVKVPDVFEDPEGYSNFMRSEIQRATLENRVELSEEMMRMQKDDYDQKKDIFVELMKENPSLQQQALKHPMPGRFVYETALKHEKLKQMENVDEFEAKIRAELETKIRAEIMGEKAVEDAKDAKLQSIKPSLANARSSKSTGDNHNKSLRDIFGR